VAVALCGALSLQRCHRTRLRGSLELVADIVIVPDIAIVTALL